MVRELGKNNGVRQDNLLQKIWGPLTIAAGGVLVVALVMLIGPFVWSGIQWYVSPTSELSVTQRKDLVLGLASVAQAAAVGLTGMAAFITLAFTWRSLSQTRESTQGTLRLTEQGQITGRFSNAIDHLGAINEDGGKNLELRLGGIYALEQIASASEEYHLPIMEVLTAYVREHAPKNPFDKTRKDDPSPDPDIQAILTVIGRRSRDSERSDVEQIVASVIGADPFLEDYPAEEQEILQEVAKGVNLREVNVKGLPMPLMLFDTDLRGSDFFNADLYAVVLHGAYLQKSDFEEADLQLGLFHSSQILIAAMVSIAR